MVELAYTADSKSAAERHPGSSPGGATKMEKGISQYTLQKASKLNPKGVIRLAKYLGLSIFGMGVEQVARLVRWRVTRRDMR